MSGFGCRSPLASQVNPESIHGKAGLAKVIGHAEMENSMRSYAHRRRRRGPGAFVVGLLLAGGALLQQSASAAAPVPGRGFGPTSDPGPGGSLGTAEIVPAACAPSTYDPEVIKVVQRVGLGLQVSSKVMLAGFEAGWVESHMNNVLCGDLDSLGVFQQRTGWGTEKERTYVVYAANAFFVRAKQEDRECPNCTAGQIAQRVQISDFPDRYDDAESTARNLMAEATRLYNDQQHLVAQTAAGGVYHTLRTGSGWTRAGNVEGQSGPISAAVTDVAPVQVNGELHVLGVAGGQIYHAARRGTNVWTTPPGWTDWGNVEGQTGSIGAVTSVAGAEVGGELHVVATTDSGVFHAIRHRGGDWTRFGNVEGQSGNIVNPTEAAAAGAGSALHVLIVSRDGVLRHALRTSAGWTDWGNVEGQTGGIGLVNDVAAATIGSSLHVVATTSTGGVFHTIRGSSGWTDFGNVEGQAGSVETAWFVGATGRPNGQLHVLVTNSAGTPYHTLRGSSGWTHFGNVDNQVQYPDEILEIDVG